MTLLCIETLPEIFIKYTIYVTQSTNTQECHYLTQWTNSWFCTLALSHLKFKHPRRNQFNSLFKVLFEVLSNSQTSCQISNKMKKSRKFWGCFSLNLGMGPLAGRRSSKILAVNAAQIGNRSNPSLEYILCWLPVNPMLADSNSDAGWE